MREYKMIWGLVVLVVVGFANAQQQYSSPQQYRPPTTYISYSSPAPQPQPIYPPEPVYPSTTASPVPVYPTPSPAPQPTYTPPTPVSTYAPPVYPTPSPVYPTYNPQPPAPVSTYSPPVYPTYTPPRPQPTYQPPATTPAPIYPMPSYGPKPTSNSYAAPQINYNNYSPTPAPYTHYSYDNSNRIPIIKLKHQIMGSEENHVDFVTGNGIQSSESTITRVAPNFGYSSSVEPTLSKSGRVSYTSPEGTFVQLNYLADSDGYKPQLTYTRANNNNYNNNYNEYSYPTQSPYRPTPPVYPTPSPVYPTPPVYTTPSPAPVQPMYSAYSTPAPKPTYSPYPTPQKPTYTSYPKPTPPAPQPQPQYQYQNKYPSPPVPSYANNPSSYELQPATTFTFHVTNEGMRYDSPASGQIYTRPTQDGKYYMQQQRLH